MAWCASGNAASLAFEALVGLLFDPGDSVRPGLLPSLEGVIARAFARRPRPPEAPNLAQVAERRLGLVRLTRPANFPHRGNGASADASSGARTRQL
jgi:hypothetical protein